MRQNPASRPVQPQGANPDRVLPERPAAPPHGRTAREAPVSDEPELASEGTVKQRKAVYTVIEQGGGRSPRWVRIGIAFVNRDGSYNVILDALPVNAMLHIRDFPPREPRESGFDG